MGVLLLFLQSTITISYKIDERIQQRRLSEEFSVDDHLQDAKSNRGRNQEEEEEDVNNDIGNNSNRIFHREVVPSIPVAPENATACPLCGRSGNELRTEMKGRWKDERIVGGEDAALNAHPWQGGLVTENETDVWCGAVLISDMYLLTAAHCAKSIHPTEEEVYVILGTNQVLEGASGNQQRISVSEVTIHKDYNPLNLHNDIALLKLHAPAVLGPTVRPICLSTEDKDYTGTMATVTGWGKLTENGEHSDTLQEVEVEVVSLEECVASYNVENVTPNHVCAGGNGTDSCQADSGGPLVVGAADGSQILLGITSWGRGCGRLGIPGVYVKVANYLSWISGEVKEDTCGYLTHLPLPPTQSLQPTHSCSCGVRNDATRIIGGSLTKVHEFPWQVAIVGYYQIRPFCGASIISDQWLLTAAHCAQEMHHDDQVMLGEHNWKHASSSVVTLRRNIAKIIKHPDYNTRPMDSDVALLKLSAPIDFSQYKNAIAPICLPPADVSFEKKIGIVTGWGVIKFGGTQSTVLRAVKVPIMNNENCKKSYGSYVTENMICAGYAQGGKDACQGDSGGPMVVKDANGQNVLAGVVSWGLKCARPHYPGVYTKVNNFLPWIHRHIEGSNTCQGR